ncbi:MAG: YraN family protein [Ardenticatenaceae bacterium]|nr:YraN family protein [Ardenticatenaceae bacterium]
MSNYRQSLGRWGESVAATYLIANGYEIISRNWRCRYGEIDLIARKNEVLHFVEVKTRRGRQMGAPEEAITPSKLQHLQHSCLTYVATQNHEEIDWSIDLIAVELDRSGKVIRVELIPHIGV